jgi:hypothetical protein
VSPPRCLPVVLPVLRVVVLVLTLFVVLELLALGYSVVDVLLVVTTAAGLGRVVVAGQPSGTFAHGWQPAVTRWREAAA